MQANELLLYQLIPPAFLEAWGPPTYQHVEFMQFFVMKDKSLVPRSRVAIGEAPSGREVNLEAGGGLFLPYPDRGRLVYRESLTAVQLHALGWSW